jgi:surface protein
MKSCILSMIFVLMLSVGILWMSADINVSASSGSKIVYSGTSGDLKWSIDSNGEFILKGNGEIGLLSSGSFCTDKNGVEHFLPDTNAPWLKYSDKIITAKIQVKNVTSLAGILSNCYNLKSVSFKGSDTSKVIDFANMISTEYELNGKRSKLKYLDLSMLDTSSAIRMTQMFYGCTSLETINITGWDTSNVTEFGSMFNSCLNLKKIKSIECLDTSNVKEMYLMFQNCNKLETLDLNTWNTGNVESFWGMFSDCRNLVTLNISRWNVKKADNFSSMFYCDEKLENVNFSNWYMKSAKDISNMFSWCYKISGDMTFSSKIESYDNAFYAAATDSSSSLVIYYEGNCSKELAEKICNTKDSVNSNISIDVIIKKKSTISLLSKTVTYSGKAKTISAASVKGSSGDVIYIYYTNKNCTSKTTKSKNGASVTGGAPVNAGTYYVKAKVDSDRHYEAATSKAVKLIIKQKSPTISVKTTTKTYKKSSLKKSSQTFSLGVKTTSGTALKYSKMSGSSKLKINAKSGKITVAKGTAKGTYKIKVKILDKSSKNYKEKSKTVTIKVKIK